LFWFNILGMVDDPVLEQELGLVDWIMVMKGIPDPETELVPGLQEFRVSQDVPGVLGTTSPLGRPTRARTRFA